MSSFSTTAGRGSPRESLVAVPVKGASLSLSRDMTVAAAFQTIATASLSHIAANARPVLECDDPEAVHQMRVGARRLRSVMTTFKSVVAGQDLEEIKDGMRWLMGALGPARDADVFASEILEPVRGAIPSDPRLVRLCALFEDARTTAKEAARAAVAESRFSHLLQRIDAWITAGDWLAAPSQSVREGKIGRFARERLDRRWRAVSRGIDRFDRLTDSERHRLRIQIKKLRYATEFMGSLFRSGAVKPFRDAVARAQDDLGALNDVTVANRILKETVFRAQQASDGPMAATERAWGAGLVVGWHQRDVRDRLAAAALTLGRLRKRPRFWV